MFARRRGWMAQLALSASLVACSPNAPSVQRITPATAPQLREVASLPLPSSFVNALVFSPDSRYLISGDRNGEVIEWERGAWNRRVYQPARGSYEADDAAGIHFYGTLALSPNGAIVVTTDPDGNVRGRDRSGNELFAFSYGARVYSTAISPDGRYLAVGGVASDIVIYDMETRARAADLPSDREYISFLAFTPNGQTVLAGYERPGNLVAAWSMSTRRELSAFSHAPERYDYHDAVVAPDGRFLLLGTTLNVREGNPNLIDVVNLEAGQVVRQFGGYEGVPYQLALSRDGSLLAAGISHGSLWIWDWVSGEPVRVIPIPGGSVASVAFSPDGTLLAFSVEREGIRIWGVGG